VLVKVTPVPDTKVTVGRSVASGVVLNADTADERLLANWVWKVCNSCANVAFTELIDVLSELNACVNALLKVWVAVMPFAVVLVLAVVVPVVLVADVPVAALLAALITALA
jgi:hypothetical protein